MGVLKVGPESAGADPGPACYGFGGTEPTVTDAALMLGYFDPEAFLGGEIELDVGAAEAALEGIAGRLGTDPLEAAEGVVDIATTNMAQAIRLTSVEKGYDPREFALVAYGGAGPMFATRIADALELDRVFVPPNPGVLSASGLLSADERFDFSLSRPTTLEPSAADAIDDVYRELETRAAETAGADYRLERSVDVRYEGQRYEQTVTVPDGPIGPDEVRTIRDRFAEAYEGIYGYTNREDPLEGVTWRLKAVDPTRPLASRPDAEAGSIERSRKGTREVYRDGDPVEYGVYDRSSLPPGATVEGPAIVEEAGSTTVVDPPFDLAVGPAGGLSIELR
jgi:N-methylhydantoinase A